MWNAAANGRLLRPFSLILAFILVLEFFSACRQTNPTVKIGLIAPFQGRNREIGYDVIYSARLAVREINQKGGINGQRVSLVAIDDLGDLTLAQTAAESMVLDPEVVAVLGHWLPETTEVGAKIFRDSGIPFILTGATPFGQNEPDNLPDSFRHNYEVVTPFEEVPGNYAGSTYDAFGLLFSAMEIAANSSGRIDRFSLKQAMQYAEFEGITGHYIFSE